MEARWLKRVNENDVEERFYPITHIDAIVMGDEMNLESLKEFANQAESLVNPKCEKYNILATGWVGDTAPYTYTVTGYDGKTVEVLEDVTMTLDQLDAIESAKIKSNPMSDENILYAFGEKPTIDLPVLLRVL
jgi:hypothetical protein